MSAIATAPVMNLTARDLESVLDELKAYHEIYSPMFQCREQRENNAEAALEESRERPWRSGWSVDGGRERFSETGERISGSQTAILWRTWETGERSGRSGCGGCGSERLHVAQSAVVPAQKVAWNGRL